MKKKQKSHIALAIAAHPGDIEFTMAGTLLRLKKAGTEIHFFNIANGSCGSESHFKYTVVQERCDETMASAKIAGAEFHMPLVDDFEIFYNTHLTARVAAIIRQVKPDIILLHSPQDYLEDHQNACRIVETAAFVREMMNFTTHPPVSPFHGDVALYHATPHGLRDSLRRLIHPGQYVDIEPVLATKREMLSQHASQFSETMGMEAFLTEMEADGKEIGRLSGQFKFAEGWRRHNCIGYGPADFDPLQSILGKACWTDPNYERSLDEGR